MPRTLVASYKAKEGKEVLLWKAEYKYDERNNKTLEAKYETRKKAIGITVSSMRRKSPLAGAQTCDKCRP